ncbi:hypothetical protein KGY47_03330 [Candidatus Bipolaricaulota bacterium]|nr:hypothetical protein [Candidatus Bipolaricaulota bacterium]MBS3814832.1 hypothetical protein [Candidatus Bipolaricaulota bacterium]MBS3825856.1 hypothetical protein [Candidatus Bipolaricaulota bacterium]
MSVEESDLNVDRQEIFFQWPDKLMGALDEKYVAGFTSGEEVPFNFAIPQGSFMGLGYAEEGPGRVDIWVNPEQVIWIEPVEAEIRKIGT